MLTKYIVSAGAFPPDVNSVPVGTLWFNKETGKLFILYKDIDSLQWIQVPSSFIIQTESTPTLTSLIVTPSTITEGESVTVSWTGASDPRDTDRIAAFVNGDNDNTNYITYEYSPGTADGSVVFTNFTVTGEVVFRYLPNNTDVSIAESNVVTVTVIPPPPVLPSFEAAWKNCSSLTSFPPMTGV